MNQEGIKAVTNSKGLDLVPTKVLHISKVYNLINALHLKSLFGINLLDDFKPSILEKSQAERMYEEFIEYRHNLKPGEEYELVENWGKDLNMSKYFELVDEASYRTRSQPLERLREIEADPFGMRSDSFKEEQMKEFIDSHTSEEINMAVAMYMVGALEKFYNKKPSEIQPIAFEIAQLGISGIDPNGKNYKVALLPGIDFSGYHLLAYYYVTWKLFNADMHEKLGLPFDKEFDIAMQFYKSH